MSAVTRNHRNPVAPGIMFLVLAGSVALFFFGAFPAGEAAVGHGYDWTAAQTTLDRLIALFLGQGSWTEAHTNTVLVWFGMPVAAAVLVLMGQAVLRPRRQEIDKAARFMGRGRQIEPLRKGSVKKKAKRLGVQGTTHPGILLARLVAGGERLYASFEDTCVDIWGSRAGKSSTRAIPVILTAPGAVLATSNKPDLVSVCAKVRALVGKVWAFDPQGICGPVIPKIFFNPLTSVKVIEDARDLAGIFEETTADTDAKKDAFFNPAGKTLITDLMFAAALAGRYLHTVFNWINRPNDDEPVQLLMKHGHTSIAARVKDVQELTEKTRGGIYKEAARMVEFLESTGLLQWITPGEGRTEFNPAEFVNSKDTLFLLSQEGTGSAGPIIAALTKAVFDAGEREAAQHKSGRLPVPLIAVLDEAANICRIRSLPEKYSHYGSKGILPMVLLQSYEQGEEVWGEYGMALMWSVANVRIYGGNAVSSKFLGDLEQLVGEYIYREEEKSYGTNGVSKSVRTHSESILSIADLASVPGDRMIILAGQSRATLARTLPWHKDRKLRRAVKNANRGPGNRRPKLKPRNTGISRSLTRKETI
ncbi:type IV secretory system conjugative DNA transfer family protein [Paenarthrobacter sp. NPDC057355]|uniref:type IV secretory system conjugative DNA transfer family protein n=1 Tax=Paenarthrobacter sp. NPDC057355 TaxID=3346105 RepID=UPI00362C4C9E